MIFEQWAVLGDRGSSRLDWGSPILIPGDARARQAQRQVHPLTAQVTSTHRHSTSQRVRGALPAVMTCPLSLTTAGRAFVRAFCALYVILNGGGGLEASIAAAAAIRLSFALLAQVRTA